jgi:hypothetical protein
MSTTSNDPFEQVSFVRLLLYTRCWFYYWVYRHLSNNVTVIILNLLLLAVSSKSQFIPGIHNIPRYGHSNQISKLASAHRSEQEDYVRGILAFVAFAAVVVYIWGVVLIALKLMLGSSNCAGGGSTMDVAKLRKQKIPRHIRRRRILRSWRIQWVFLGASILIPITTLLMTRNGLKPLINSLDEVGSISDEVEAVAFRGLAIAESLQHARQNLQRNLTGLQLGKICPTSPLPPTNTSTLTLPVGPLTNYIQVGLDEVNGFIDQYADEASIGLTRVVGVTEGVDNSIEWIFRNDWTFKLFLLTLNVVNGFFLLGVFLSKQDIISYSYRRFLSYGMIPLFLLLLVCGMLIACVLGMSSMFNAGKSS